MTYNTSKAVVYRNIRYLDDMLSARQTLTWPVSVPKELAYRIRESLYAARQHEEFLRFHILYDWYRVRTKPGYVEVEYIGPPTEITSESGGSTPHTVFAPKPMVVPEADSVEAIVGACIKLKVRADELNFPSVHLTYDELYVLFRWGSTEVPPWKLINHDEQGITLTRRKNVEEAFLWQPSGDNKD